MELNGGQSELNSVPLTSSFSTRQITRTVPRGFSQPISLQHTKEGTLFCNKNVGIINRSPQWNKDVHGHTTKWHTIEGCSSEIRWLQESFPPNVTYLCNPMIPPQTTTTTRPRIGVNSWLVCFTCCRMPILAHIPHLTHKSRRGGKVNLLLLLFGQTHVQIRTSSLDGRILICL